MWIEKRHVLVVQQAGHDVGVAPVPAAAQEPVAIDDAVTGQCPAGATFSAQPTVRPAWGVPRARAIAP